MRVLNQGHPYSTRSLRSLVVWAWRRASRELTPGQRDLADYDFAVVEIKTNPRNSLSSTRLRLQAGVSAEIAARYALVFWLWRGGIKKPWRIADSIDVSSAPKLRCLAPRKPKPKPPPRNRATADADKWASKRAGKEAHVTKIEDELEVLKKRKKALQRRLKKARADRRRIRANEKAALQRAIDESSAELTNRDFSARMRAKRKAKGAAPAAR